MFVKLNKSLVRPHLEYGNVIWYPSWKGNQRWSRKYSNSWDICYPVRRSLKGVMFLSVSVCLCVCLSVCLSVCVSVDIMECWTFLEDYGTESNQTWYDYNHHWALRSYTIVGDLWPLCRSQGQHMFKTDSFNISGTTHVINMKLGMDIKYINHISYISVLFG